MELGSGGPTEAIVGPTEEPVEEILGINLKRREEEKGGSAFPQHRKLPSYCVLSKPPLYLYILLPCHRKMEHWEKMEQWDKYLRW